jgi:hypothetical protein
VPTPTNAGIGLVHTPVAADRPAVPASRIAEERQKALDPAVGGALVDQDAALGQPLADLRRYRTRLVAATATALRDASS